MSSYFRDQYTSVETLNTNDYTLHLDRLGQERRNSNALAMELRISCTNQSICQIASFDILCLMINDGIDNSGHILDLQSKGKITIMMELITQLAWAQIA